MYGLNIEVANGVPKVKVVPLYDDAQHQIPDPSEEVVEVGGASIIQSNTGESFTLSAPM